MQHIISNYTAIFEPAEGGGYVVYIPALPGCATQGDTFEEAINEISYVASSLVEMYKEEGLSVPLELKETKKQKSSAPFFFNFPLIKSGNHA